MNKITITVSVDGNSVSREYAGDTFSHTEDEEVWGIRIVDMLDTIEKSKEVHF